MYWPRWIDDDRDYSHCPYNICERISDDHSACEDIQMRYSRKKDEVWDDEIVCPLPCDFPDGNHTICQAVVDRRTKGVATVDEVFIHRWKFWTFMKPNYFTPEQDETIISNDELIDLWEQINRWEEEEAA